MSFPFIDLGVRPELSKLLARSGVSEPTPIQQQALPVVFRGGDVIAQAQTGTGKTLAFLLPMLERTNPTRAEVQGLILTPTRELAIQIAAEAAKLAPALGINVLAAYGGQDVEKQLRKLSSTGGVHLIVATPGRLLDHLRRGSVALYKISMLVLDEADQMLHMGFLNEVEEIIAQTPQRRQTMLFSATMPDPIRNLAKRYMVNPEEIRVKAKQVTLTEIDQSVVRVTDRGKLDALCRAIDTDKPYLAMIFCRTKRRAASLNADLQERGYKSDELHGDLSQAKREQVMKRFRDASIQLLVATDVAARGIDVEGVTHVFNYDIPHDAQSYIHRIGRTGRAGQTGVAVTFASPRDQVYVDQIEQGIRQQLRRQDAPRRERGEETDERRERGGRSPRGERSFGGSDRAKPAGKGGGRSRGGDGAGRSEGRWEHRADGPRGGSGGRGRGRADARDAGGPRSGGAGRGTRGDGGFRGDNAERRDSADRGGRGRSGAERGGFGGARGGSGRDDFGGARGGSAGRGPRSESARDSGRGARDRDSVAGPFGEAGWGVSARQREETEARNSRGRGGADSRGPRGGGSGRGDFGGSRSGGAGRGSRGGGSNGRGAGPRGGGSRSGGPGPRGGSKRGR
ncbi:DEAD/DEAH box helicase [Paenibacillus chitinolyticus]|uniref:DEAD/DEAH box helicase n=4 Tax=Paenibacillus chitinolyticus TaxID=79263 RepID=A0A410X420_9BACL|nr:DEAD/DEAH box helicase [Paenibacillus chitinolyticus]QAV21362.1 DEAD/DEAH box helicase [Paenibacillus chitinolyticus]